MNRPKVLILTSSYPKHKGDVNGNFVYELAIRLKSDFDIFVIAPAFKGSPSIESVEGIKIFRHRQFIINYIELAYGTGINENLKRNKLKYLVLPFYFFFQIQLLKEITKKEKIDLVHAHWLIPNAFTAVLCKKIFNKNFRILATIHGSDMWGITNNIGLLLKKYTLNNIDSLTVVSNAIKEKVFELGYKKEVFVFPMGLNTNLFSPSKRDNNLKSKLDIKGPFLLFVGIIVEQKGIRYLIQAMPKVIMAFPEAKLVVIGEGNLKNEMVELTKQLKVSENIIFTGSMQHYDLPPYFATADLFILPSFSEGWPVVVMEALSSGTATIVTNLPVFEKHEHKEQLFTLVPVGNSELLAKAINKLFSDHEILLSTQDDLINYAKSYLDWGIISENYKNLFNSLIN